MFKLLKRNKIYTDNWLTFYQDEVEFLSGQKGTYAWVKRKNGVSIVVVTTENSILLNKEYRYVIDGYSWEIPGGGIDDGETPIDAAKRELYEETGIKTEKMGKTTEFYPINSFNQEKIVVYQTIIEPTLLSNTKTESSEYVSEQKFFSFPEVLTMIDNGEICDAVSANAIQIVIRKLQNSLNV